MSKGSCDFFKKNITRKGILVAAFGVVCSVLYNHFGCFKPKPTQIETVLVENKALRAEVGEVNAKIDTLQSQNREMQAVVCEVANILRSQLPRTPNTEPLGDQNG